MLRGIQEGDRLACCEHQAGEPVEGTNLVKLDANKHPIYIVNLKQPGLARFLDGRRYEVDGIACCEWCWKKAKELDIKLEEDDPPFFTALNVWRGEYQLR